MVFSRRRFLFWLAGSTGVVAVALYLLRVQSTRTGDAAATPGRHPGAAGWPAVDAKDVARFLRSDHKQTEYIDKKGVHVVVGR